MKEIQCCGSKNLIIILTGILFFSGPTTFSQISNYRLQQADSLFAAKQYTQSVEHYRAILAQKQYSPSMLLKMAFVEEGLNNTGEALYYLNLYYLATKDKSVLEKMEELASKYSLEGYESTDADRLLSFYQDYHMPVSIALTVIIFFFLSLAVYLKRRKQHLVAAVIMMVFLVVALGIHVNLGEQISTGIVSQPNTYLMEGPSSGASVISVIPAGHRVEIIGKRDVWLKIHWNGQTAYVKENKLLPIAL